MTAKISVCAGILSMSLLGFFPSLGSTATVNVNCSTGTLQSAITAANTGDTIVVTGTCNENVILDEGRGDLTLDGQGTATIHGLTATAVISIRARGVTIKRLTVTGGSNGIQVLRGGTATIDGNTIQNTGSSGILVNQQSFAIIINNTISSVPNNGISVSENSSARIGVVNFNDVAPSPNIIQNNGTNGISIVASSSAIIVGNTIRNNQDDGVEVFRASHADISKNIINGNLSNGINIGENSGVNLGEDTTVTFFDEPNSTTINNSKFGIVCGTGAYANGRLGTLKGTSGTTSFAGSCINSLI